MTLLAVLAIPFLAALALAAVPERARNLAATIAGAAALAAGALLALLAPEIFAGHVVAVAWPWLPLPGADFGLRADGLAWTFAALVLGIGALVVLYARYYLSDDDPIVRFYAFFLFFMGAMLGIVLADNLILLVVFWELTSLASFLLIGYWRHDATARQGARMALAITGGGGLCLLAGALLLGEIVGSVKLEVVLAAGALIRSHGLYLPALLLVLLGAFTKSAQFPFHFWLPSAMAAPTPASAYLHSATMVKAGVFLLARLYPALAGSEPWFLVVSGVGLATLVVGAYVAVFQHDLKGLLAYSTISHLGLITLLFGLNSPLATVAGVFHILNHATFKASLFMAAGIIDHESGTRDMRVLNGLRFSMPYTSVLATIAAGAMAGVPLLNGFLSKEMFLAETLHLEGHRAFALTVPVLAALATAFSVAYSVRFIHDVFFHDTDVPIPRSPHEPPVWMLLPVAVLALTCLLVGLLPGATIGPLLATSARAALGGELPAYSLAIWHGVSAPLLMSLGALALGTAFYFSLQRIFRLHDLVHLPRGGKEAFDALVALLLRAARALAALHERGVLTRQLLAIALAALAAAALPLAGAAFAWQGGRALEARPVVWMLWAMGVAATLGVALLHRERVVALVLLGIVGLVVSLAFVGFSAPDLALTQVLVEVVSIILMMLALYYLPRRGAPEPGRLRRLRDGAIATLAGGGVAALAYAVLTRPGAPISESLLAMSVPEGAGANVVNVIIVDFRAFDTLGEITVLAVAALIVFALARDFRPRPAEAQPPPEPRSPLLQVVSRPLLPLALLVSAYLFLRGHNEPGGGFIAGLVLAVALLIVYLASGIAWVEQRVRLDFARTAGAGLLVAGLTGLGSLALAHPFLTSTYLAPQLPLLGKIPLASAMIFDLGVYLTVAGGTLLALVALGRVTRSPAVEGA